MPGLLDRTPLLRTAFALFVAIVFVTSAIEIVLEVLDGETLGAMIDDVLRFVVGLLILGGFLYEHRRQRQALSDLLRRPNGARGRLAALDADAPALASQYRAVVQKQFDVWGLTTSEQDVVIGMLKGLSFREIAALRETREKTVRQQASSVYAKAGVASRSELAAWFFEDLLDAPSAMERR